MLGSSHADSSHVGQDTEDGQEPDDDGDNYDDVHDTFDFQVHGDVAISEP